MLRRTGLTADPDKARAWHQRSAVTAAANRGPGSRLRPVSDRQRARNAAYRPVRDRYLEQHRDCEARAPGCTGRALHVHHRRGRMKLRDGPDRLIDDSEFCSVCPNCHEWIENSVEALGTEFKLTRL